MMLFWEQGFHGTSTKELADHMGINSYSLFAEFGSKQGLFETAMALYEREVVTHYFAELEAPDAGLGELIAVFDFFSAAAGGAGAERGCFLCNVATERAPFDPQSRSFVDGYVERIQGAILRALTNAEARGELRDDVSCVDQSWLLTTSLLGFWVLMRAGFGRDTLAPAADAAKANLTRMGARPS